MGGWGQHSTKVTLALLIQPPWVQILAGQIKHSVLRMLLRNSEWQQTKKINLMSMRRARSQVNGWLPALKVKVLNDESVASEVAWGFQFQL